MDWEVDQICTVSEALRLMRKHRKGHQFMISCHLFLPTTENRGFPGYTNVRVTYREAQRVVRETMRNFEERGARIRIKVGSSLVFVG